MEFYVYKHTCPNEKIYIGITKQQPIKRWGYNGYGYRKNTLFYRAIQKYGWSNIKHEILYENLSKEEAEQKEIELIEKYKSNQPKYGYNIANGGNTTGTVSEATKEKISKTLKGYEFSDERRKNISINTRKAMAKSEIRKKISEANKGRTNWRKGLKLTEEEREKLKKHGFKKGNIPWNKGKKGLQTHTEEWKLQAKIRQKELMKKRQTPVICVETGEIFESQMEASRIKKISQGNIGSCLRGKRNIAGGYHWKYERKEKLICN